MSSGAGAGGPRTHGSGRRRLASPVIAQRYFAYGSNLASRIIEAWAPDAEFVGPARLDGFRLAFLRRSVRWKAGAADVVPAPGHAVWGALYLVSKEELDALDSKEYVARSGYRRCDVEVEWEGKLVGAATYEVVDKADDELTPKLEYLTLMWEGARERGLPEEWLAELASLPERFGLDRDVGRPAPGEARRIGSRP